MSKTAEAMMERIEKCDKFFHSLTELLKDEYEVVGEAFLEDVEKPGQIGVSYLLPKDANAVCGFRYADFWNYTVDTPYGLHTCYQCSCIPAPEAPHKYTTAVTVGYFGQDLKYHPVYGEVCSHGKWYFKERTPEEVVKYLKDKGWM